MGRHYNRQQDDDVPIIAFVLVAFVCAYHGILVHEKKSRAQADENTPIYSHTPTTVHYLFLATREPYSLIETIFQM